MAALYALSATPTTPLPMEFDPKRAFEKIFGHGRSAEKRAEISGDYLSVLDLVSEQATALKRRLGPEDRVMLDDYLDSVREIERRIALIGERDLSRLDLPELPVALPTVEEHQTLERLGFFAEALPDLIPPQAPALRAENLAPATWIN